MNKFYGKELKDFTFGEMTLLSIDIQILSYEKSNLGTKIINESLVIREGFLTKCMNDGGDYDRERFRREFNGESNLELGGVFTEYEIVTPKFLS